MVQNVKKMIVGKGDIIYEDDFPNKNYSKVLWQNSDRIDLKNLIVPEMPRIK